MSNDDKTQSVNIRVSAQTWEELSGENRSEICREALRAASQMKRDAGKSMKYANEYEKALNELDEVRAEVEVKRMMMENELQAHGCEKLVRSEDLPDQFSLFDEMLVYAGNYAKGYLKQDRDKDWTTNAIMQDMRDEGKVLPVGIAEWIVDIAEEEVEKEADEQEVEATS